MKKITLLIIMLLAFDFGFGQIIYFNFQGLTGITVTDTSDFNDDALTFSTVSRGVGLEGAANDDGFAAKGWSTISIEDAVTNNDYFEFSITPNTGFEFNVSTIAFSIARSANGLSELALRSSADGYNTNIDGTRLVADLRRTPESFSFDVSQTNNTSAVTYRIYGYAESSRGSTRLKGPDNDILVYGSVASIPPSSCLLSDNFTGPSLSSSWTDFGGNSSIVSDQLSIGTGGITNFDYIYQNANTSYNTILNTLSNTISWEFNMRQSRVDPSGFESIRYGSAFIIGGTDADITQGNGYAIVFGETGASDDIRLVSYTNGLNGTLTDIIAGVTDYGRNYLSIRVSYDPSSDTWELFVRDDGLLFFSNPISIDATDSVGTVVNTEYTSSNLNYIAAVFNHATDVTHTTIFDNLCISTSSDCSSPAVTWTAGAWSPLSGPTINTPVIINDNYDTATDGGSFSACNLTVNATYTLKISDVNNGAAINTFVQVANDVDVDGEINIDPQAAFLQNNDAATTTINTGGTIKVTKETAPMDAWYEYTYWSSPVFGTTIASAIDRYNPNRAFIFNAQNFLDATAEIGNNDEKLLDQQDDIDDNGDDWQWVDGSSTTMLPGVGYATTVTPTAYNTSPAGPNKQFSFTFEGPFNNGVYNIPVYRNNSETDDNNWNLIGNPYPSAINADLFLAANANINTNTETNYTMDGAIFLWSQDKAPSAIANGNQQLNFSDEDYAIINGIGEISGGDGLTPTRFIPSGQAFFITYTDAATPISTVGDISEGSVIFNNGMRVAGITTTENSQFFKNSNSKKRSGSTINKLWVNLTSDNNVSNQALVAYVNGASDNDDGAYFDAEKKASVVTGAVLYSNIEGSNKKFGIQGKSSSSLNMDETISLGIKSNIGAATLFKLSIDRLEGDFLTGNTIYLKDNLLNKSHNLTASDYSFTTEIGEFNERFEIVFTDNALSTNGTKISSNKFSIINLNNNNVQFNTNSNLNIKTVSIYDLLGRQVYDLSGQTSSETYNLPNLKNAVYIAKIELSNGITITKKAIKK